VEPEQTDLLIEDRGRVRFIRINRPQTLNSMPRDLVIRLVTAIEEAEQNRDLRAVVVGSVGPHFSSGYDMAGHGKIKLGATKVGIVDDVQGVRKNGQLWRRIWESAIPVVAAVRGYCLAGGTDLALHCDLIVAGGSAKFGFPAVRHQGVPPTNMWNERIGLSWTKRLLLTGDLLGAETAARIGLAIDVVEDDQVDEEALKLANRMALIDRELLMANKLAINMSADANNRGIQQQISAVMDAVAHRADCITGFWQRVEQVGIRDTWKERNALFGDTKLL
jgi:enoyl-CoA hydratase